jgi:uncharacterized protein (DUF433 family)
MNLRDFVKRAAHVFDTAPAVRHRSRMKIGESKMLGQYIVADPRICRGRPTFKGTRVTVADVLADVEKGLSWDFIAHRWGDGKINRDAIAEAVLACSSGFSRSGAAW